MASSPTNDPPLPPVKLDPLAALMSYLIPGLGQIYQGRIGKGLLFFGGLFTSCRHPSMRYRTRSRFSNGSMWMSEPRIL